MYPKIHPAESADPKVRGRLLDTDIALAANHGVIERSYHHEPAPEIMEVLHADGSLTYEVVDGPNCSHLCEKCRIDIDAGMAEFGSGAVGMFNNSSEGELERLRKELKALASAMVNVINRQIAAPETTTQDQLASGKDGEG